ncbi:hypothetical protein ACFFW8_15240 [Erwinia tracheiphila]
MNKLQLVSIISLLTGAVFSGQAIAATSNAVAGGIITFSGAVSDATCDVTTNNGSDLLWLFHRLPVMHLVPPQV